MEEALRGYFIASGFYVVRGVKFYFGGVDVTDIDVWLYARTSPVSRHRVIVDVKNKRTPQAMERIFWARGVQEVLGLDQAIVATTDTRDVTADFGRQHGVIVLDGSFIMRLVKTQEPMRARISEEEFNKLVEGYALGKLAGDWKTRLRLSKSLVSCLDYNSINVWLAEGRFFAEQIMLLEKHRATAARLLYFIISLVTIGVDFVLKDLAFVDSAQRKRAIDDGLRHGTGGEAGMQKVLDLATGLAEQYVSEGATAARAIREGVRRDFADLPTAVLTEFFSQHAVAQSLFGSARELEHAAYSSLFLEPERLSAACQSVLGVLLDYWHMDRAKFYRAFAALSADSSRTANTSLDGGPEGDAQLPLDAQV